MDTIPETDESMELSNPLLENYIRRIKDLLILDEVMLRHIHLFTKEEKMELIVVMNEVILCLISLLD